jgi:hypothetical protein
LGACGQEARLTQVLGRDNFIAEKSGLLAKRGWRWGGWPGCMDTKVICHRNDPGENYSTDFEWFCGKDLCMVCEWILTLPLSRK